LKITQGAKKAFFFLIAHSELAIQIQKVILALGDYMNVQCHACIGGHSIGEDIQKLDYGQHVVSGTPGRYAHSNSEPSCRRLTQLPSSFFFFPCTKVSST